MSCAEAVVDTSNGCLVCRTPIERVLRVCVSTKHWLRTFRRTLETLHLDY